MITKSRLWTIALLALALVAAGVGWRTFLGPRTLSLEIVRQDRVQTLVLNGRVLAPRRVALGAQTAGVVSARLVEEGDRVHAGQPLLKLEDAEALALLRQAEARRALVLEVASPAGEAALIQAEATLAQAEAAFRRAERLFREGVFAQAQLEEAQRALDVARAGREASRVQARSAASGADLRAATSFVALARAQLDQRTLRAPLDGVVLARLVEVGDAVQPGRVLLSLALDEPLQLLVQPDEKHLAELTVGQQALVSADAFPDQRFKAEVAYVAPAVDPQRGTVDVKLKILGAPRFLRADMTVSVELEQGRRSGMIALPLDAVRGWPDNPHVLVRRKGRAEVQPLRLGFRGTREVEVLEGLQAGDIVFTSPAAQAGQRLRPER